MSAMMARIAATTLSMTALCLPLRWYCGLREAAAARSDSEASAPIELTGYWTAVITEDYRLRMLAAPKGDFGSARLEQ